MSKAPFKQSSKIIDFIIIALLVYLGSQYLFPRFFGKTTELPVASVVVSMKDATLIPGQDPILIVRNDTTTSLSLPLWCPNPPVSIVYFGESGTGSATTVDAVEPVS